MKKIIISIITILFLLSTPLYAATALILADINWSGGKQLEDGTWTGARAILPTDECGEATSCLAGGGFEGWYSGSKLGMITLRMAEKGKLPQAHVYIRCSEANLIIISTIKKPDEEYKFILVDLIDQEAKDTKLELELDPENNDNGSLEIR